MPGGGRLRISPAVQGSKEHPSPRGVFLRAGPGRARVLLPLVRGRGPRLGYRRPTPRSAQPGPSRVCSVSEWITLCFQEFGLIEGLTSSLFSRLILFQIKDLDNLILKRIHQIIALNKVIVKKAIDCYSNVCRHSRR